MTRLVVTLSFGAWLIYSVAASSPRHVMEPYEGSQAHVLALLVVSAVLAATLFTRRSRDAESLRQSEERYRHLFENASDVLFTHDLDGNLTSLNKAGETLTGWKREELLGKSLSALLSPSDLAVVLAGITRLDEEPVTYQVEIQTRDGRRVPLEVSTRLLKQEGRPAEVQGIARDITERRVAEEARRRHEEHFRVLIENASDIITILDLDGTIRYESPSIKRSLGWEPEELVGQNAFDYVHSDDLAHVLDVFKKATETHGVAPSVEFRFRHKNGSWRTLEAIGNNVVGESYFSGVVVNSRDVTERRETDEEQKRLQQAVQKSAAEWRLTFDAVSSPLLVLDRDGRIERLNRTARELLGGGYDDLRGQRLQVYLDRGAGEPWRTSVELARLILEGRLPLSAQARDAASGRTWDVTVSLSEGSPGSAEPLGRPDSHEPLRRGGSPEPSATGVGPRRLRADDAPRQERDSHEPPRRGGGAPRQEREDDRVIVVAREITDTVSLQESLRRSEVMSAMGSLVAGVAHEVRNPLFGISATLDAFENRFGVQEGYQRYIQILRGELARLSALMQDLLEYGRPPTSDLYSGSVESIIHQAVRQCRPLADTRAVQVQNRIERKFGAVAMDAGRLIQVFNNLIENAIHHSQPGDTVTIDAEEILQQGEAWIHTSVRDRGPGFLEEDFPKVFQPFYTRRRGGTGLGLSIVQRIVDEHRGRITAGNHPEGGAVLEVWLPVVGAPRTLTRI